MKYDLVLSGRFKKSLKLAKKRGLDISLLDSVVKDLLYQIPLNAKHKDHALRGKWSGFRECHIQPHGKRKLYEFFVNWGISVFTIKTIHKDVMIRLFCAQQPDMGFSHV